MRIEHYVKDMQAVAGVLSDVASCASCFQPHVRAIRVVGKKTHNHETWLTATSTFNRYAEILEQSTGRYVKLVHEISGMSAEQIRHIFDEGDIELLKSLDHSIRGLEGFVRGLIRDGYAENEPLYRLCKSVLNFRTAVSDVIMILNQSFVLLTEVESETQPVVDASVFENFSFH